MPKSGQKQTKNNKNKKPTSSSRQICLHTIISKHYRNICLVYFSEHRKRKVTSIISLLQLGKFGSRGNWAICLGTKHKSWHSWEPSHISRIRMTCSKLPFQAQDEMTWCPFASDNGIFFPSEAVVCEQSPQRKIKGIDCLWLCFFFASVHIWVWEVWETETPFLQQLLRAMGVVRPLQDL